MIIWAAHKTLRSACFGNKTYDKIEDVIDIKRQSPKLFIIHTYFLKIVELLEIYLQIGI